MAYVLSNGLARFTFIDHATTGAQLYSFEATGSGQVWLNAQTALWNASVYDTTTAPTTTTTTLTPQAAYFSASSATDSDGDYLTFSWTNIPLTGGDLLNVVVTCRLNTGEDFLRTTISASWSTGARWALHDIGPLPLAVDPLNEGTDVAVLGANFGIIAGDPIETLRYQAVAPTGFPDTGFNGQTTNRWSYPSGRGWAMALWGYYDESTNHGWMLWLEDWCYEHTYITFESNGTRLLWDSEQPQEDNVLAGNNGRSLGSGYTFCLRPMQITQKHGWANMGIFYRSRVEAGAPEWFVPVLPDRTDLSATEKMPGLFIDMHLLDTVHTPGSGDPGDLTTLVNTIRSNSGAPAGTPVIGIVEGNNYNLQYVGETADGDLQSKLSTLYSSHNCFLSNWWPAETGSDGPGVWSIYRWDQSVGDSAELRWFTSVDELGAMRMSRTGYLAGGGTDRLKEQGATTYYRQRTYPVTGWTGGTLTVAVTGTPNADGFTGTLRAVIIPASGAARLGEATVSSLGASSIVVTSVFTDSLGNTVTPAGGDTITVHVEIGSNQMSVFCAEARVNAATYLTRLCNNMSVGVQAAHKACGIYLDTWTEPLLQSAAQGRTGCYRDHSTWSQIDPGYTRHPYGGGSWWKEAIRELADQLKSRAKARQVADGTTEYFHISVEDVDETMLDRVDWCWHIISSGNLWRVAQNSGADADPTVHKYKTVPLFAVVYSGRTMGRGLDNELSGIILNGLNPLDPPNHFYDDDELIRFFGYCLAVEWPYGITWPTLSVYEDDTTTLADWFDNTLYVAGGGSVPNKVKQIRDLWVQIATAETNWLLDAGFRYGRMMPPAVVDATTSTTTGMAQSTWTDPAPLYHSYDTIYDRATFPRVVNSVWKATDGTVLVVLANWTDTAATWSGVVPIDDAGLGSPGSLQASRIVSRRLDYTGAESGTVTFESVTGRASTTVAAYTIAVIELTSGTGGSGMATIVKGSTFSSTVTAGGLHALVESATISGIERGSVRTSEISLATLSTTELSSPADNEVWQTSPGNQLVTFDDATDRYLGGLPQIIQYTLSSSSAAAVAGNALMPSGSVFVGLDDIQDLTLATGANTGKVLAIALAACSPGGTSVAVISGPVRVKTTGTVNVGEGLKLSSTDGVLQSAGAVGSGQGWQVVATATTAASGGLCWANLRR